MTTAYVECPQCGKRALSVATRCPHCGFHFPARPLHRTADAAPLGRPRTTLAVALAVAAIVIVALIARHGPPEMAGSRVAPATRDSATDASVAPPAPGPVTDTVAAPPVPAAGGPNLRRYARTWVNVRGARARSAQAVAILNPGDAVVADSLVGGWYRVLVDGRALGYVHRSTLGATRPE